jgi:hypothetical protein
VSGSELPEELRTCLSDSQLSSFSFGCSSHRIASATLTTKQVAPRSIGFRIGAEIQDRFYTKSAIFAGVGSKEQKATNLQQTDVQLELEGSNGSRCSLSRSLPIAVTASFNAGEEATVYYYKGGLPGRDDSFAAEWTAFAIIQVESGKVIPLAPLPTLAAPKTQDLVSYFLVVFGLRFLLFSPMPFCDSSLQLIWRTLEFVLMVLAGATLLLLAFIFGPQRNKAIKLWEAEISAARESVRAEVSVES